MHLLIVSDSHGRELKEVFDKEYPRWVVKIIVVGAGTDQVRETYMRRQQDAISFRPDNIILHVGHNDVVYHSYHNRSPRHIKEFFLDVLSFLGLLQEAHPELKLFYSTMLPRASSRVMSEEKKSQYNSLSARFGVRAQSSCRREGYGFLLNACLWQSLRQKIENPDFFDAGGLHLNKTGKRVMVEGWMKTMFPVETAADGASVDGGASYNG
jgi:lysophospholipase L1-like esterase